MSRNNRYESEFGIWSTGTSPSSKGLFVPANIKFHSCSPEPSPIDQLENRSFAIALADKAELCRREFPLAVNKKVVGSESIPPYCSETRLLSIMTA
jgi:hypothetical protein